VIKQLQNLVTPQLTMNKQLTAKKLQPLQLISEQDWQKAQNAAEGDGPAAGLFNIY